MFPSGSTWLVLGGGGTPLVQFSTTTSVLLPVPSVNHYANTLIIAAQSYTIKMIYLTILLLSKYVIFKGLALIKIESIIFAQESLSHSI